MTITQFKQQDEETYLLSMSGDGNQFKDQYTFNLEARTINDFMDSCLDKQTNPGSHFVKNRICTKFTADGRWTIRNDQWIEILHKTKSEFQIKSENELQQLLLNKFDIRI
ncbi:MAG: arylamine N-acetyltransferase [Saprospiraceae bacterium]|nr:arylamine N-acetyltransferase [Saprospiraceae bacterium]